MTLRPEYTLGHSEYNAFLFAVVHEEEVGLPLTVLTALTRLGVDPWQEAARLSDLPREVAARALAETIAKLPQRGRMASDSKAIAARLVNWLPARSVLAIPAVHVERTEASRIGGRRAKSGLATGLLWGGLAIAAVFLTLYLQTDNNLEPAGRAGAQTEQQIL